MGHPKNLNVGTRPLNPNGSSGAVRPGRRCAFTLRPAPGGPVRRRRTKRLNASGVNENNMESVAVSLTRAAQRRSPARRTRTPGVPTELVRARFQACRKAEASQPASAAEASGVETPLVLPFARHGSSRALTFGTSHGFYSTMNMNRNRRIPLKQTIRARSIRQQIAFLHGHGSAF